MEKLTQRQRRETHRDMALYLIEECELRLRTGSGHLEDAKLLAELQRWLLEYRELDE